LRYNVFPSLVPIVHAVARKIEMRSQAHQLYSSDVRLAMKTTNIRCTHIRESLIYF
jgi:hypothetical protein